MLSSGSRARRRLNRTRRRIVDDQLSGARLIVHELGQAICAPWSTRLHVEGALPAQDFGAHLDQLVHRSYSCEDGIDLLDHSLESAGVIENREALKRHSPLETIRALVFLKARLRSALAFTALSVTDVPPDAEHLGAIVYPAVMVSTHSRGGIGTPMPLTARGS